jgi:hypothetical protein
MPSLRTLKDGIYNDPPERIVNDKYGSWNNDPWSRLENALKEIEYLKNEINHFEQTKYLWKNELESLKKFINLLELALHIAVGNDEKKREILEQAKKSIEVLQIFEKEELK